LVSLSSGRVAYAAEPGMGWNEVGPMGPDCLSDSGFITWDGETLVSSDSGCAACTVESDTEVAQGGADDG